MAKVQILDHGYIEYIEHWGSDERIVEAARMSTGKGFLGWGPKCKNCGQPFSPPVGLYGTNDVPCPHCNKCYTSESGDEKLLEYLYNNKHSTPFEMAGMVIEVQAPIFVFREWHRHRTQSYNEMSARYIPLPDINCVPTVERCLMVSGTNKQASSVKGSQVLTHESVLEWLEELANAYAVAEACYQSGLRRGIPKEVARFPVPVARYSRMRASANLRNWLHFLSLRMDSHAQWEIRQFANMLGTALIASTFPRTWNLFLKP